MKLLMITRKVDLEDASPAGFTYNWVKKIGERLERLYVITWQKSNRGKLSDNIKIDDLSGSKFKKIFILPFKVLKFAFKANAVFCHQNPEYAILALPAKLLGRKIIIWYAHGSVNWKLKLVNLIVDKILTSSKKGCRLKNRKNIKIIGQGIDINYFNLLSVKRDKNFFKIISVGRISPTKGYETLIQAIEILLKQGIKGLEIEIIGGPVLKSDQKYFEELKQMVKEKKIGNYIKFLGPIPHSQILPYYQSCDLFINLSQTGSLDKTGLEAMACQKLVLTSNEAFKDILKDKRLLFEPKNHQDLTQKIINLMNLPKGEREKIGKELREIVIRDHSLDNLVDKIIKISLNA